MKNKVIFLIIIGLILAGLYFIDNKFHFSSKIKNILHPKENLVFVDINKKVQKNKEKITPSKAEINLPKEKNEITNESLKSHKNNYIRQKNYIEVIPYYSSKTRTTSPIQPSSKKTCNEKSELCDNNHSSLKTIPVCPDDKDVLSTDKSYCNNIKVYNIEYTDAKALCKFINRNLKHKKGKKLAVLKDNNQIILNGTKEEMYLAEAVINKLDEKPQTAIFRVAYTDPCKMANMLSYTIFEGKKIVKKQQSSPLGIVINDIYFNNEQNTITITGATERQLELANQFIQLTDKCCNEADIDLTIVSFSQDNISKFNEICDNKCSEKYFTVSTQDFNTTIQELVKTGNGKIISKSTKTLKNTQSCQINLYEELNKCKKFKRNEKKHLEQIAMNITISPLISFNKQAFLSINTNYTFIKKTTKGIFDTDKCAIQKVLNLKNIPLDECETLVISCDTFSQDYIKRHKLRTKNQKIVIFARIKAN